MSQYEPLTEWMKQLQAGDRDSAKTRRKSESCGKCAGDNDLIEQLSGSEPTTEMAAQVTEEFGAIDFSARLTRTGRIGNPENGGIYQRGDRGQMEKIGAHQRTKTGVMEVRTCPVDPAIVPNSARHAANAPVVLSKLQHLFLWHEVGNGNPH